MAASTFAGEFRSGTSADNNEITEMSYLSVGSNGANLEGLLTTVSTEWTGNHLSPASSYPHSSSPGACYSSAHFPIMNKRQLTSIDIQTSPFLSLVE